MDFTSYSRTHQGQVRQLNEDSVHIERRKRQQGGELFVVADGMGGHQSGEVASQQAIETITAIYYQEVFKNDSQMALKKAIEEANTVIYQRAQQENRTGMGTTVVAGVRLNDILHYAHVGDSRLYLVRNDQIQQLTNDHSLVAEQVAAGILTPEEAENHPHRNVISRAVGTSSRVAVELASQPIKLEDGDALILCSDGLTEHVKADRILQLIRGRMPEEASQELINAANAGGGSDNISVIVLRAGKPKAAATTVRRSTVTGAPTQNGSPTSVQRAPLKAPRPPKAKKKRSLALPAALGVVALLLLVVIGGGLWTLTNNNADDVAEPAVVEATSIAEEAESSVAADTPDDGGNADNGTSEEAGGEAGSEPDNTVASGGEQPPIPTEEPTHTVPPGAPTSTRRPTFTPSPTQIPITPSATPMPPTYTPVPTTAPPTQPSRAPEPTAVQPTNTPVPSPTAQPEIAAAQADEPTNTPIPTNTPLPPATNTPEPPSSPGSPTSEPPTATQPPPPTATTAPIVAIPTVAPLPTATQPPPTQVPTQPPPTLPPTQPPLPTETPVPAAPANYSDGPIAQKPVDEASIKSENVTFEWQWNGPALAGGQGQQFRVMGFRDGEWLNLATTSANQAQVNMRGFGNFETNWQWYVVVINSAGADISPRSATLKFNISLPRGGGDSGGDDGGGDDGGGDPPPSRGD